MHYFKKRGVSPLIATILLIAFAVALGSVIMNWGLNLDLSDKCNLVDYSLRVSALDSKICMGGTGEDSYLDMVIDNKGSMNINGVSFLIIGEKETSFLDVEGISVPARGTFEVAEGMVKFNSDATGPLQAVELTPKIISDGKTERCTKKALAVDKIGRC